MKLIDADLLIDMFKNDIAKTEHYINTSKYVSDETKKRYGKIIKIFEEYIEIIEHLPATYDVDKVVKQLEKESELIRPVGWVYPQEVILTRSVLETIKRGGIDE